MGKSASRVGLFVGLMATVVALAVWKFAGRGSPALSQREMATRVLAEYIQGKVRAKSVLVVGNPFSQTPGRPENVYRYQTAAVEGLRKGFGEATELKVEFPALKPEVMKDPGSAAVDPGSKTPLSFLVTATAFDDLQTENPKSEVIVSLIGLPVDIRAVRSWQGGPPPYFALLLPDWRMMGGREQILDAFKRGKLLAAVVEKAGAPAEEKLQTSDYQAAFEGRYLLVTAENVEELIRAQPQLFGLR